MNRTVQVEVYGHDLGDGYYYRRFYPEQARQNEAMADNYARLFARIFANERVERLVDIGSGGGNYLPCLQPFCQKVISLEYVLPLMQRQRSFVASDGDMSRFRFVNACAEAIPLADASVDGVLVMEALHHFQDWRRFLAEMTRILTPGGRFVFVEPNAWNPLSLAIGTVLREERGIFRNRPRLLCQALYRDFDLDLQFTNEPIISGPKARWIGRTLDLCLPRRYAVRFILTGRKKNEAQLIDSSSQFGNQSRWQRRCDWRRC